MIEDINDPLNTTTDLNNITAMFLLMFKAQLSQAKTSEERREILRQLYALTQSLFVTQFKAMEGAITIDDFGAIFLADAKLNSDFEKSQKETDK